MTVWCPTYRSRSISGTERASAPPSPYVSVSQVGWPSRFIFMIISFRRHPFFLLEAIAMPGHPSRCLV
jgi:hypothetical protein